LVKGKEEKFTQGGPGGFSKGGLGRVLTQNIWFFGFLGEGRS